MRPFATRLHLLPMALLPLALFGAFFHWQILDITNVAWLLTGTDNGENALGLHAWLHDPAPGLLHTGLLNAPEGAGLLFTDSNPLLSLLVFPLQGILPADTQVIGWWLLACLFLQVFFAWRLLRDHAPGQLALWCGVFLLAALPSLFNRFGHVNLMAHWLILWALWRFIDARRAPSDTGWAVLIAITALVHSYLLVMVGAIWASAMMERAWRERGDWRGVARIAASSTAILILVAGIAWILGVAQPHQPSGNYGAFAMPLDALWNPGVDTYSTFLPAIEQRPGRGFEGFQYLGLGLLILLPLAAVLARRLPVRDAGDDLGRLYWLVPALIVLTLLAISTYPDIAGHRLPRIGLSQDVLNALDAVRASGRLFWPVAYVLVLVAVRIAYRLPARRAAQVLAALAVVQIADLAPMAAAIRNQTAVARTGVVPRTPSPLWDELIAQANDIAFVPADVTRDLGRFQEIAWRAAKAKVPVRSVYAARSGTATLARQAEEDAAFRRGDLVPGRLYILIDGEPVPPGRMLDARPVDGVSVMLLPNAPVSPFSSPR
ncbi:MAG: hypothetical protein CVT77_04820 [Alphaproteobacteria bacterium HGW-Alphaproteobacteria-16]|nr:MAG: hypothetical protein CVT77_04820 [Alphaproteobacteria bacterium HGW-Alphaproteobacteria-16]